MFQRIICISCSKLFLFRVLWDKGSALEFSSTLLLQQYPRSTYPHTSIILFMLYPLASKRNHPTLKTCPPFVPQKKKKLIRALIPPKYLSSVSEPPTELPYDSDRPPDELCIPPDIEPKPKTRRLRFTARSRETFPGHPTLAFRLCRHFQNRCMSRIITRRTSALWTQHQPITPTSALTVSAHVSRPAGGEHG